MAVLSEYRAAVRKRKLGLFVGHGRIRADFDSLPPDMLEAFEGGKKVEAGKKVEGGKK